MANVVDVNVEGARAANDTFQKGIEKANVVYESIVSNPFNALCSVNPDLASSYLSEFGNSAVDILNFAIKIRDAVNGYLTKIQETEQEDPKDEETPDPPKNPYGGGGDDPTQPPTDPETPPAVVPPVTGEVIDTSALVDLTVEELDSVIDDLVQLAEKEGKDLDKLLEDPMAADKVKAALLASPYIPEDLKKLLEEADPELVRQTVIALMNGEMPEVFDLNPLNVGIVYSYLCKIASDNGITVEQLLNDPQYSELLKQHLAGFEDVVDLIKSWKDLSSEKLQANLLKIYDGDEIGGMKDETVDIMRTFVDYIADATEIPAEELLLDTKYADILKNATEQFGKTSVFMGAASHYSGEGMQNVVGSLVDGSNAAALGMDESEVTGFKSEIDALAKEKGVTAETLLSDSKYADDVKNTLAASENAKEVGLIYEKSESSVSQKVAKNLYNTEFKVENTTATTDATASQNSNAVTDGSVQKQ